MGEMLWNLTEWLDFVEVSGSLRESLVVLHIVIFVVILLNNAINCNDIAIRAKHKAIRMHYNLIRLARIKQHFEVH